MNKSDVVRFIMGVVVVLGLTLFFQNCADIRVPEGELENAQPTPRP